MKRLNRYAKHSPLNKKLRQLYEIKKQINNCNFLTWGNHRELISCVDKEINECWRNHYQGIKGFEIDVDMTNCRRNTPLPISCAHKWSNTD